MHAPPGSNHARPPEQPRMPPGATMHAPPGSNHARPPVNRITDACENITLRAVKTTSLQHVRANDPSKSYQTELFVSQTNAFKTWQWYLH